MTVVVAVGTVIVSSVAVLCWNVGLPGFHCCCYGSNCCHCSWQFRNVSLHCSRCTFHCRLRGRRLTRAAFAPRGIDEDPANELRHDSGIGTSLCCWGSAGIARDVAPLPVTVAGLSKHDTAHQRCHCCWIEPQSGTLSHSMLAIWRSSVACVVEMVASHGCHCRLCSYTCCLHCRNHSSRVRHCSS